MTPPPFLTECPNRRPLQDIGFSGSDPGICVRGYSPFPHPSSFLPFPSRLRSRAHLNKLGDLGERGKLPSGVLGGATADNEFGAL